MRGLSKVEVAYFDSPKQYVFAEHQGAYEEIRTAFKRIMVSCEENALDSEPLTLASIWLDDPEDTPTDELHSRACVFVDSVEDLPRQVQTDEIPIGKYAKMVYQGPYSGLAKAWEFFYGVWLPHSGERSIGPGPGFQVYRTRPRFVPDDELETELYIPLKP